MLITPSPRGRGPINPQPAFYLKIYAIINLMAKALEKINKLEKELKILKSLIKPKIDYSIDEEIWSKIRKELKKSRKLTYKKYYGRK